MFAGKNCYADELWQQKFFQILHHVLDPKMGVEKWTQKWCQNLTPKMGVQKWHPKRGSKNGTQKIVKMKIKLWFLLDQDIGPPFGCHFWTPILVVKFWHHFWVHFSTPILGSKTWCKIWKKFAAKAHLHSNSFPANMHHKMHV